MAAIFVFALIGDGAAGAQALTPQAAVERLLRAEHASADWFTADFLAQVPLGRIDAVMAQYRTQGGAFERVESRDGVLYAVFAKGEAKTQVVLDSQGRFTGLLFGSLVIKVATLEDALKGLRAPGGDLGYVIVKDGTQLAALEPDRPMAVGSAFKLAVLAALRAQVDAKQRTWSDVVPLDPGFKSLPTGVLRDWPDGTPLTLAAYAAEMISISDNTAADALVHIVGRAPIEALAPRNEPFLTTREMFALKTKDASLRTDYRRDSSQARRALLARLDAQPLPAVADLDTDPSLLDIEWYFSPRELCALMARVQDLPLMTINPGFPRDPWRRVAYKGGSDWGVLNFTSYVTAKSGHSYCVTATWNNPQAQIDEGSAGLAFGSLLDYLSR